jgi:hypothetical protein
MEQKGPARILDKSRTLNYPKTLNLESDFLNLKKGLRLNIKI